jgi:multidrug transporter EmrE-like cation transporter
MTKSTALILAFACVLLSALAQLSMKWGMSGLDSSQGMGNTYMQALRSGWVWSGLMLYGGSAVMWLLVLTKLDVSVAYPLVSLGFVITIVAGVMLMSEPISAIRIAASGLIVAGVTLLALDA